MRHPRKLKVVFFHKVMPKRNTLSHWGDCGSHEKAGCLVMFAVKWPKGLSPWHSSCSEATTHPVGLEDFSNKNTSGNLGSFHPDHFYLLCHTYAGFHLSSAHLVLQCAIVSQVSNESVGYDFTKNLFYFYFLSMPIEPDDLKTCCLCQLPLDGGTNFEV